MKKDGFIIIVTIFGMKHHTFCKDEEILFDIFKHRVKGLATMLKKPIPTFTEILEAYEDWDYIIDEDNNVEIYPCRIEE